MMKMPKTDPLTDDRYLFRKKLLSRLGKAEPKKGTTGPDKPQEDQSIGFKGILYNFPKRRGGSRRIIGNKMT